MTFGRRIVHASNQGRLRCEDEFINRTGVGSAVHRFEDLKQTPSLALITLRVQDAFPFEINDIVKAEKSRRCPPQAPELCRSFAPFACAASARILSHAPPHPPNKKSTLKIIVTA